MRRRALFDQHPIRLSSTSSCSPHFHSKPLPCDPNICKRGGMNDFLHPDALSIHRTIVTLDTHIDIPWPTGPDPFQEGPRRVDLPKMIRGGLSAACFVAYVPQTTRTPGSEAAAYARAIAMLDQISAMRHTPHTDPHADRQPGRCDRGRQAGWHFGDRAVCRKWLCHRRRPQPHRRISSPRRDLHDHDP